MKILCILVLGFVGCKSGFDHLQSNEKQKVYSLDSPYKSTFYEEPYDTSIYLVIGDQVHEKRPHRDLFDLYRDRLKASTYPQKYNYDYNFVDKKGNNQSPGSLIMSYVLLAKSGDIEVEQFLLRFYKELIDLALAEQNTGKKSKTKKGAISMWHKIRLNNLPPSIEKIDLIMKFVGQELVQSYHLEPDEDVLYFYGDFWTFNMLIFNVDRQYWTDKYKRMQIDIDFANANLYEVKELYKKIKNGSVQLIDRDRWKRLK